AVMVVATAAGFGARSLWVTTPTSPVTMQTASRPLNKGTTQGRFMRTGPVCPSPPLSEDQAVGAHHRVDDDMAALGVPTLEDGQRQRITDLPLDQPLQRSSPVDRVVALGRQPLFGRFGDLEIEAAVGQSLPQRLQLDVDDPL